MVATLSRRVGVQNIEAVEDAVQAALMAALETWRLKGLPRDPSAWLFRVAHNRLLGALRTRSRRARLLDAAERPTTQSAVEPFLEGEVQDDLLRMLFVCCDDALTPESQLVLALKTLCGFDVREIAQRLFKAEAGIYKRLARARARLRARPPAFDAMSEAQYAARLSAVHRILYLLFTEGYLSSRAEAPIRGELCQEAIRLAEVLAAHPVGRAPETFALLALMHLHVARMGGREDPVGGLLLLEEQDRNLWEVQRIQVGLGWLARSAEGEVFSRYHAEAGIAAEHCLAPSFEETRWDRVVECYALLEQSAPSPIHTLNRALAVAEWKGPEAGLALLEALDPPRWLEASYLWPAALADLHRRCGHHTRAAAQGRRALERAPSPAVRALLGRRLEKTQSTVASPTTRGS